MSMTITGGALPGLHALMARMAEANRSTLVGVPEGAEPEKDGTPIAMIAAVHEFGSPEQNIYERSFLRAGVREAKHKLIATNVDSLRKVVRGQLTVEQAVDRLGVVAAGEVKRKIKTGQFEPNKPATIKRKGSSRPLIDTAQLLQSITHVVEGKQSANARVIE